MNEYIDKIVSLAQEVEITDPIDWGMLSLDEDSAYKLVTMSVLNELGVRSVDGQIEFQIEKDIMIATIVKLVVENFVLNLKLTGKEKDGNKTLRL